MAPPSMRVHCCVPGSHSTALAKSLRYSTTTRGGGLTENVRDTVGTRCGYPVPREVTSEITEHIPAYVAETAIAGVKPVRDGPVTEVDSVAGVASVVGVRTVFGGTSCRSQPRF